MTTTNRSAERLAWLCLARTPRLGAGRLAELLERFGSADQIVAAPRAKLTAAGLSAASVDALQEARQLAQSDAYWLDADPARHVLTLTDPRYPERLRQIASPPPVLFIVGDPEVLLAPQLAVVGSRNPTPQGRENARVFTDALARRGLTITSGMALGIDAIAHTAALDAGGLTVAICGTGLDRVYPARHRDLAHRIAADGALVSEFSPGMPPLPQNFPRRNRIISALSLGTLVVEAATASGSLITARVAAEQGRDVFAIPGSIHNPLARGCHQLIRQGGKLVETADDVLEELAGQIGDALVPLQGESSAESAAGQSAPDHAQDPEYVALLDALGDAPQAIDTLVERSGLTAESVSSMLLMLELEGRIAPAPGGRFMRVQSSA